jgi:hypothetical protein
VGKIARRDFAHAECTECRRVEPPHPEEAAKAVVSKDGAAPCPSCFETPRHSACKTRVNALEARLLSMRAAAPERSLE